MGALVEMFSDDTEKQGNIYDRKVPDNKRNITPWNGLVNPSYKRLFVQSERHHQRPEVFLLSKDLEHGLGVSSMESSNGSKVTISSKE